ncbi:MAG: Na/Pi symporter [Castellaniella sp.]|uniref:Na/Pi cotransporter family protein n=1 Tax=Castellaniella sp. TaxID=1955812 RepID=UPI003C71F57E
MIEFIFPFIGGIGLFLIGMKLLSDGLVAFAGGSLRSALVRFTDTSLKACLSGVVVTAVVQSSTATTVTLIGFVSAGLITFTQAIGVVIGASLGNTATGWIVAGLGLKISLGFYTLPMIGVGAMMHLLAAGRWKSMGLALAGFGTLFLGLDTLQEGMQGMASVLSFADLPVGGYGAYFLVMLTGLALTAVLQSSTAAVAMTLTALHAQAINFDQAAALVIGASIGTTLTSALVAIGGSLYAKRTALAYILFNLAAGLIATALLPVLIKLIDYANQHGLAPGALSLAAFHSLFIGIGVAIFLPLTPRFAYWVEKLMPERKDDAAQHLDDSLLGVPTVALEASQRALEDMAVQLVDGYEHLLAGQAGNQIEPTLARIQPVLEHAFDFVTRIQAPPGDAAAAAQQVAQLHAIDHLLRLRARLLDMARASVDFKRPEFQGVVGKSQDLLAQIRAVIALPAPQTTRDWLERIGENAWALTHLSTLARQEFLQGTHPGGAARTLHTTDVFRWLDRTGRHIWRACHHLAQGRYPETALSKSSPTQDADSTELEAV